MIGPWSFLEAGGSLGAGTFVDPQLFSMAGLWTSLTAGWGFDAGPLHLRPSARFSFAYELTLPDQSVGSRATWTPLVLSLAATNLLDEPRTGLRLTPAFGLTVPTSVSRSTPLTTLSLALQLERRFGPVELAFRSEAAKPLYGLSTTPPSLCYACPIEEQPRVNWFWENSLQAEGWITDSFSLGLSLAWNIAWGFPVPIEQTSPYASAVGARSLTTGRVFVSWAFTRLFGLSFDLNTTQPPLDGLQRVRFPFLSLGSWAENRTVLSLSLWFRTDVALARNWIER